MEKQDKITLEASGEFPFQFFIEKAVAGEEDNDLLIEGIASTTNIDHDNERMSESALRAMEAAINEKGVPLRVEHQKEDEAVIGKVYKAWVDERNQLHVKARLDKAHPVSSILHSSMKQGAKMGLSVGGLVKRAVRELSEKTGKMVKTFFDVVLSEVSVTPRPANYDSWLIAKSITDNEADGERFRDSALYDEFLFENPKLDYLQAFAKSIPDGAWHKIASQDDETSMKNESKKTEEKDDETATKAVSRSEFKAFTTLVSKGFADINALMAKALHVDAHDQNEPVQDKEEQIGNEAHTAKTEGRREGQEDEGGNGSDEHGEREKTSGDDETKETTKGEEDAKDTNNPNKDKPKEIGDKGEKAKSTKKDTTDEYDLETVERATKAMSDLLARVNKTTETDEDKKEKSETETDTEKAETEDEKDETKKGIHPLDAFVAVVSKTMSAMVEKMEKTGKSIPGFEKSLINNIRENPELQAEIADLIKVPGFKKSVAMGVPYVRTKDGRQFALTMTDAGATTLEKSQKEDNKGKSFKEVFKSEFSSVKQAE